MPSKIKIQNQTNSSKTDPDELKVRKSAKGVLAKVSTVAHVRDLDPAVLRNLDTVDIDGIGSQRGDIIIALVKRKIEIDQEDKKNGNVIIMADGDVEEAKKLYEEDQFKYFESRFANSQNGAKG